MRTTGRPPARPAPVRAATPARSTPVRVATPARPARPAGPKPARAATAAVRDTGLFATAALTLLSIATTAAVTFVFAAMVASPAQAASAGPAYSGLRFVGAINRLELALREATGNGAFFRQSAPAQAETLRRANVRAHAYSLQSLGRLYADYPVKDVAKFAEVARDRAKDLEDLLGAYDKHVALRHSSKAEKAARELMRAIGDERWIDWSGRSPALNDLRKRLVSVRWLPPAQDRRYALDRIAGQADEILGERYDMRRLEKKGLHELRRDLRWILLSIQALEGDVVASPKKACPQPRLFFTAGIHARFMPPAVSSDPNACVISQCLAGEITGAVGLFGKLKDQAEALSDRDPRLEKADLTAPAIATAAHSMYATLLRSRALENFREQIRACAR